MCNILYSIWFIVDVEKILLKENIMNEERISNLIKVIYRFIFGIRKGFDCLYKI